MNALRGPRVCIYVHTCHCVVLWCKDDVQMQRDTGVTAVHYSESLVARGSLCVSLRDLVETLRCWLFSAARVFSVQL